MATRRCTPPAAAAARGRRDAREGRRERSRQRRHPPLYAACGDGSRAEVVTALLAENADVARPPTMAPRRCTPPAAAAAPVVTALLANADVNQAANDGTAVVRRLRRQRAAEVVALLASADREDPERPPTMAPRRCTPPAAATAAESSGAARENADVNKADNEGNTPLYVACENGDLGVVSSSYGAGQFYRHLRQSSRSAVRHRGAPRHRTGPPRTPPGSLRAATGHCSTTWSSSRPSARSSCCVTASAPMPGPGDPTPLDRARALPLGAPTLARRRVVLEWGAPWKRRRTFYPPAVRARRVALMWIAQSIRRGKAWYEVKFSEASYEALPAAFADVFGCVIRTSLSSGVM